MSIKRRVLCAFDMKVAIISMFGAPNVLPFRPVVGKLDFPGWDGKFQASGGEDQNQCWGKSRLPPYKYYPARIFHEALILNASNSSVERLNVSLNTI